MAFKKYYVHQAHTALWNSDTGRWGDVTPVAGLGQSWTNEPSLSPDKQWLFYVGSSGHEGKIYRSQWLCDKWGPGELLDKTLKIGRIL